MDIVTAKLLFDGLVDYNANLKKNYGNVVVPFPAQDPTYPYTIFNEIRNVANASYNTCYDKVASVGYRVVVFAKTKGKVTKLDIARDIAQKIDTYLTNVGLLRVSYNASELENDSSIYQIIMTYSGNLFENRRKFI